MFFLSCLDICIMKMIGQLSIELNKSVAVFLTDKERSKFFCKHLSFSTQQIILYVVTGVLALDTVIVAIILTVHQSKYPDVRYIGIKDMELYIGWF